MSLIQWFFRLMTLQPHFVVGSENEPYLLRWWMIPRNSFFNVYLHKFLRDDIDRALHDHPWTSLSLVLRGGYYEITDKGKRWYGPASLIFRSATHRHRIVLPKPGRPAWTLFMTGRKRREWGFWCPQGFVPWRDFVAADDAGRVGKGCAQ